MKEWETEPDYDSFSIGGYQCRIWRNAALGFLCGYVRMLASHPLWAKRYDDPAFEDIRVHGGLTYSDEQGEIGFDCGRYGDFIPYVYSNDGIPPNQYRNMDYVKDQIRGLVAQLQEKEHE